MIQVEYEMWSFKRADDLGQPERVETICRSSGYNVRDPGCNQWDVRGNHWGKVSLGGVRYLGAWVLTVAGMRHGMDEATGLLLRTLGVNVCWNVMGWIR